MRLVVVIPTLGRQEQVSRLLIHLARQHRLPDAAVISASNADDVPAQPFAAAFPVSVVLGPRGLSTQRNRALERTLGRFDVITFFDDDFIPADDYLARICAAFAEHPDWAVVMGNVVRDGASTAGLDWQEGLDALCEPPPNPESPPEIVHHLGAYGCNMSIRARLVGDLRFDERLALYGWQEDVDFTSRLRRRGAVVAVSNIRGVHLGTKSGRVSGERFGYSQVANPIYLIRKGSVPAGFALRLIGRNVAANLLGSIRPEPHIDRRGRLRGNIRALAHVLTGRIEPEYIMNI